MAKFKGNFKRYEKKFLLENEQYLALTEKLREHMVPDAYGQCTICNIYFDTDNMRLIRTSIEKPFYKEKLRLRCYKVPDDETVAFIEIKKKVNGIVYKRRVFTTYKKAYDYLTKGESLKLDSQISKEIDWFVKFYKDLKPAVVLTYDRSAFFNVVNNDLRITFDSNITWRNNDLDLKRGVYGNKLLQDGQFLMEVKIPGSMPLWLVELFTQLNIRPMSYSKYGNAYKTVYQDYLNF